MVHQTDSASLTILLTFIIVFIQKKMAIAQSFIIYAVISFFFGSFADPKLLYIAPHEGIVFVTVILFLIALLFFNEHKVQ